MKHETTVFRVTPIKKSVRFAMRLLLYYFTFAALSYNVFCARILGLFPHTAKSHQMVFEPLLQTLAERGHHVTVASFYPLKSPPANYTDVSLEGITGIGIETINLQWFEESGILPKIPIIGRVVKSLFVFDSLVGIALNICNNAVNWPPLTKALKKEYDLVFVENFNSDCMLGLLHVYNIKAPVVALSASMLMPWSHQRIGAADNPSYLPVLSTSLTYPMTLLERVENTFWKVYYNLWFYYAIQVKEQAILEKQFGKKLPELGDLARNTSLIFLNTFHALNGVRPQLPGLVEVGGMHLNPKRTSMPQFIEKFLNESEHGVLLFSFGSLIKTSTMPKYKEEILINCLSKLKQRVIWKYEDSGEEGTLTGNILRVRWIPQYDLLRHDKVIAFLAHGGLLGMTEAVSAGKPMVVVPFFADQPTNAAAAEAAGFAKIVSYANLNEKDLTEALQTVLSAEMRMNARRVSRIWHDRPLSPLDTAVYWTERVLRWGHLSPLHSVARDMPFYQLALLDVAAVYLLAVVIVFALIWLILSKISRLFMKESKQKLH